METLRPVYAVKGDYTIFRYNMLFSHKVLDLGTIRSSVFVSFAQGNEFVCCRHQELVFMADDVKASSEIQIFYVHGDDPAAF